MILARGACALADGHRPLRSIALLALLCLVATPVQGEPNLPEAPTATPADTWLVPFPQSAHVLEYTADGNTAVAADLDGTAYLFESGYDQVRSRYSLGTDFRSLAITPDGSRIVLGVLEPRRAGVFDRDASEPRWTFAVDDRPRPLDISDDGALVMVGTNGSLYLLDGEDGVQRQRWDLPLAGQGDTWGWFTPDGASIVVQTRVAVRVFDIGASAPRWQWDAPSTDPRIRWGEVRSVAFADDLSTVAITGWGVAPNKLWILEGDEGTVRWERGFGDNASPGDVALSADGSRIALTTSEGLLYRFDSAAPEELLTTAIGPAVPSESDDPDVHSDAPFYAGLAVIDDAGRYVAVTVDLFPGQVVIGDNRALWFFGWEESAPRWQYRFNQIGDRLWMAPGGQRVAVAARVLPSAGILSFDPDGGIPKDNGGGGDDSSTKGPADLRSVIVRGGAVPLVAGIVTVVLLLSFTQVGRMTILPPFVGVFSRLRREELLDHGVRLDILQYVIRNPGAHLNEVRDDLSLSNGQVSHHLRALVREEYLLSRRRGARVHFYVPDTASAKHAPPAGTVDEIVVELLRRSDGLTQGELAAQAGLDQSTISRALVGLHKARVVVVSQGRPTVYSLSPTPDHDPTRRAS